MGTMIDRSMSTSYAPVGRGKGEPGAGCAMAEAATATVKTGNQRCEREDQRWLMVYIQKGVGRRVRRPQGSSIATRCAPELRRAPRSTSLPLAPARVTTTPA